jgi:hypothetical protein
LPYLGSVCDRFPPEAILSFFIPPHFLRLSPRSRTGCMPHASRPVSCMLAAGASLTLRRVDPVQRLGSPVPAVHASTARIWSPPMSACDASFLHLAASASPCTLISQRPCTLPASALLPPPTSPRCDLAWHFQHPTVSYEGGAQFHYYKKVFRIGS